MGLIASYTAAGGVVGDTFGADSIVRVFADGVYGWMPTAAVGDLYDVVANLAARKVIGTGSGQAGDGYKTKVTTNGLVYEVVDGAYAVADYQTKVGDVAARDLLTEVVTGQRVYIDADDRIDRWDGTVWVPGPSSSKLYATYAELPAPNTVRVGTTARVTFDPIAGLNGEHIALGAAPGALATYWDEA